MMSNSSIASNGRRSMRTQKKQTTLQFAALPASSPAKVDYDPAIQARLASVRFEGARKTRSSSKNQTNIDIPLTPEPSSQIQRNGSASPVPQSSTKSTSLISLNPPILSESSEDEINAILPSAKRRRVVFNALNNAPTSLETPTRRSARITGQHTPQSSAVKPHRDITVSTKQEENVKGVSELGSPETSGDEDGTLAARPNRTRRSSTTYDAARSNHKDIESDDSDEISRSTRKSRTKPAKFDFIADDDEIEFLTSDDDTIRKPTHTSPSKGTRNPRSPRTRRLKRRSEQKELEDDLADLRDSEPEEDTIAHTRTRGGPVTTQKDRAKAHFERLKRRRAGERISREASFEDEAGSEEEAVDIEFIGQPSRGRTNAESVSSASTNADDQLVHQYEVAEEADEDDFIVEDSTGRLGRPHADIPLEFTSFASARPRELFPHIIEWLVKNKIAPAFSRDDPLYRLAFDRVNDQVKAQAGSRLISAAWGAIFRHTILARPGIMVESTGWLESDGLRTCDACNRTNHPASYDFVFSGQAYSQDTLEPIDQSDDEDEETEDDDEGDGNADRESHDEAGHVLAPQHHHFYLGSHCAANAEMGHKLTHWKHHLNTSLIEYLEEQGVLSAEAILAREKLNKRKREREAEAIVDNMQQIGKMKELWQAFQDDLDDARLGMEDFQKKGRGKGRIGTIKTFTTNGTIREWNRDKYKETRAVPESNGLESDSD